MNKKTIVLFSRSKLSDLYGLISRELEDEYRIIHVAYSSNEKKHLSSKFNIECDFVLTDLVSKYSKKLVATEDDLVYLDKLILEMTDSRFSLSGVIQADRTFSGLDYNKAVYLVYIYNYIWNEIVTLYNVSLILHEPTSLVINHMAAIQCKLANAKYVSPIQVYGAEKYNIALVSGDDCIFDEFYSNKKKGRSVSKEIVEDFHQKFKAGYDFVPFANKNASIFGMLQKLLIDIGSKIYYMFLSRENQIEKHIENYLFTSRKPIRNLYNSFVASYTFNYDTPMDGELYYYYAMHLEPEAVVLYWGDNLYTGQVKLIENIASQLPVNTYLYVKDHPHGGAQRNISDLMKIKSIPNVKLIDPTLNGKALIKDCIGSITINGTSGLEAILLGKRCIVFGNAWYRFFTAVEKVHDLKSLRDTLENVNHNSDLETTLLELGVYLGSIHSGFTNYFLDHVKKSGIDEVENAKLVALALKKYIQRVSWR